MRTFLVPMLIALFALCPVLCGAEEGGCGQHHAGTADAQPEAPSAPAHCPEDGDNCICGGAVVQPADSLVHQADDFALPAFLSARDLGHTPAHPIAHLTWDGSSTGLAGWGDSLDVRAFLQNFRF